MSLEDVIIAHAKYKLDLRKLVEPGVSVKLPQDGVMIWLEKQECWLHHLPSFQSLRRNHEAFCNYVAAVMSLLGEGRKKQARDLIANEMFVLLSDEVVRNVMTLDRELGMPSGVTRPSFRQLKTF